MDTGPNDSPQRPDAAPTGSVAAPNRRKKWIKRLFHLVVITVTVWFLGSNLIAAADEFRSHDFHLRWNWVAAAVVGYIASLTLLGTPMYLVFLNFDEPVTYAQSIRAYLISHLGKYVPGKAMAIVLRCTFLTPLGLTVGRVTLTTFYETFAAMASGSVVAILCLSALPAPVEYARAVAMQPWILWCGLAAVAAGFVGLVTPRGFGFFTWIATRSSQRARRYAADRIRFPVFVGSMLFGCAAWGMTGLSYVAVIFAVGDFDFSVTLLLLATGSVALSIVGGFLSMIPGQALVREAILIQALTPVLGQLHAVLASLLFRLITLAAESGTATALYIWGGRR